MPEFQPPPTWANPVLSEKDPLTGKDKSGFNPVWLKWFVDLASVLSGTSSSGYGFSLPPGQFLFGNAAGFAITSDRLEWDDASQTLTLGNEAEFGTLSGGSFGSATRGEPGTVIVSGSPNPGSDGGFVKIEAGDAGTDGGSGGDIEILSGDPQGSGTGGDISILAAGSVSSTGNAGNVTIASGAGDNGGDSGNVTIQAAPVAGGGGNPGYVFLDGMTRWQPFLVANLPAFGAGIYRAVVTDAVGPAFLAVVVGGGAVTTPVFYDGANWRCG